VADHRLLPEGYLYGTTYALRMAGQRSAFLLGQYSLTGWWWFFPYAFLVKTPLPLFALLVLAAAAALWKLRAASTEATAWRRALSGLYVTAPLWVLLLVYWAFAVTSKLNIGHRHLLPTYPVLFIFAGAAGLWLSRQTRVLCAIVLASALLFVTDSITGRPNYLAYFNQLIGSPGSAYQHFVDSSLDWGQDLPGLKKWLDERGLNPSQPQMDVPPDATNAAGDAGIRTSTPVYVSYFGTGNVRYYGINGTLLTCFLSQDPLPSMPAIRGGVFCISATMLQAVYLRPPGYWTVEHESLYQQVRRYLAANHMFEGTEDDRRRRLAATHDPNLFPAYRAFADLRTSRLCAYLRKREPEAQIGRSILIYRLTEDEAHQALEGPPAELLPRGVH
jgi:hypothetical protein